MSIQIIEKKTQIKRDVLYYAANIEPEIERMFRAHDDGNSLAAEEFKKHAIRTIDKILELDELSGAGREEWFSIRNMVEGYDKIDGYARRVLLSFGKPFSIKFMQQFA